MLSKALEQLAAPVTEAVTKPVQRVFTRFLDRTFTSALGAAMGTTVVVAAIGGWKWAFKNKKEVNLTVNNNSAPNPAPNPTPPSA
jgi:uncharacterized membrane protein required for colicin V production